MVSGSEQNCGEQNCSERSSGKQQGEYEEVVNRAMVSETGWPSSGKAANRLGRSGKLVGRKW